MNATVHQLDDLPQGSLKQRCKLCDKEFPAYLPKGEVYEQVINPEGHRHITTIPPKCVTINHCTNDNRTAS